MKYIKIFLYSCLAVALLQSCYKDLGNYNYGPQEEIQILGIPDTIIKVTAVDKITLSPNVISSAPVADFEYRWGVYRNNGAVDTIARTKDIDYLVVQKSATWKLMLLVRNKKTGNQQVHTSTLLVNTPFTQGWYVLKDDGQSADIDLFGLSGGKVIPEKESPSFENVLSMINGGRKLSGPGRMLTYASTYRSTIEDGKTLANTKVLFALSESDASVIHLNTFKELADINSLFFNPPAKSNPLSLANSFSVSSLVNDGKVNYLAVNGINTGRYTTEAIINDADSPYRMSRYFASFFMGPIQGTYYFDELGSSFYAVDPNSVQMPIVPARGTSKMKTTNNNKTLLYLGARSTTDTVAYALFQDKTSPMEKTLATIAFNMHPQTRIHSADVKYAETLPAQSKLSDAQKITAAADKSAFLFFAVDKNEVWSRSITTNGAERMVVSLPTTEEITFIRHRVLTGRYAYNYLMVGAKSAAGYKVYLFPAISEGQFAQSAVAVLRGGGVATDAIFISTNDMINGGIYTNTY